MNKCWQMVIIPVIGCLLVQAKAFGQATNQVGGLQWFDAHALAVEGKGWPQTKHFYDRWPARAEAMLRAAVWDLGQDSAGMSIRFVTDATAISARWTLRRERLAMPHMPASGVSGLDLYVKAGGKWQWLGGGRPDKSPTDEKRLVGNMKPGRREYLLYLPLYNGVEALEIGIPQDAKAGAGAAPPGRAQAHRVLRHVHCAGRLRLAPGHGLSRRSWAGVWAGSRSTWAFRATPGANPKWPNCSPNSTLRFMCSTRSRT